MFTTTLDPRIIAAVEKIADEEMLPVSRTVDRLLLKSIQLREIELGRKYMPEETEQKT